MSACTTVFDTLLKPNFPLRIALRCAQGVPLTYFALSCLIERTCHALRSGGVSANDRVALVLERGPHQATAFTAVGAIATAAPLNPGYSEAEFEFCLSDLKPRLLIVDAHSVSGATSIASRLEIPIATLQLEPQLGAGYFTLQFPSSVKKLAPLGLPDAKIDDVALVLHTSGTTSRPKLVPLSRRNLSASAAHIRSTLALTENDRALNVMPLYHIHGLVAGILAPLSAGGEVFCTGGFNAFKFFSWMSEAKPTWYTAVPTIHQALLARANAHSRIIKENPLRLIRSSSSPLPPQVYRELESTFSAPVIEAYGMTEAAHQIASSQLPPAHRAPGTVGVAAGPEICILNPAGEMVPSGSAGEIAIRGPNVMCGYDDNAQANAGAFIGGWFRTGDQGIITPNGFLTITGRLKEIINRGGEKVSPREVDEVLLDHPDVAQCATFAVQHEKLGEEVAAVIVLREGATADERSFRAFAAERLADFKVPRRILIMDEIPKGPTGKVQRIGLAKKLGL